jgi:hypothetical protein
MKSLLRLLILIGLAASARAQLDTESTPPDQDQNDLFARAAASRLVVIGKVVESQGVPKRIPPEALEERLKNGTARGGSLVTVQLEETVCRQSDFDRNAPQVEEGSRLLYLFIPFDDSDLPAGRYREVLLPQHRYLLLLEALDPRSLSVTYQLDSSRSYYRGEEENRGVVPLDVPRPSTRTQNPPEVVDKFRKLCAAMRPANAEDKLALLQQLADSGDSVLQKEAENAIKAVKAKIVLEQSPKAQPR